MSFLIDIRRKPNTEKKRSGFEVPHGVASDIWRKPYMSKKRSGLRMLHCVASETW
ncbi:hypothetical protein BRYFOR_09517 [Marvinbryantia formatexigens DSM 14469]|uniref:Uncharacterized protein n=1 Tax=Marvinbryantia formatexigens DSM 14469 TaxID=478749 RepID=C6LLH0_9FIRM|nr:hypothetical protein BRYFOR_09517 [Marvinbryantia formatexigens DSM 14469]